ncbi:hypothetical protein PHET_00116 [Paragonimus heterotremus]|uniref:VWFD domain-containing protein n=1 Tax=Paragonimus heterotremus TaxID=100268 RepID=A0A8J4TQG4_9TREM|nr:hypothetical protein PHET_00116 [Paragonimus heterotremus]
MSFQSIVLWGTKIRALLQEKAHETVDLRKLQSFKTCFLKDLQSAPDTIAKWLENDVLFVRTLNVPVLKELAKFNFYELEKNVTKSLSTYISVVNHMLNKSFSETNWTLEWLNTTKTMILNERLQSMRSTVVELLKLANFSLQMKSKTANYLFQQVVGAMRAVYNLQTRVLDWIKMLQEQTISITLSPLADVCREFGAYLVEQAPSLEPLKQLVKTSFEELGELLMRNFHFWSDLVFGSLSEKNGSQLPYSSSSDQLENASHMFASSQLTELKADLDQGIIHFTTYIPPTLRTFYGYTTNTDSYPRQIMSWIYPKHGMKSVIYMYDQYQKNFDAIKKIINLIPPYSVSGWLVIGPHHHAHLVTFNEQFFLLPKIEKISYLLLRDINTNIFRIVQYFEQSSWSTTVEFGAIRINVNNLGEVRKLRPGDEVLVPLPYKVEQSGAFIYMERSMDRITLHGGHQNLHQRLYTVHFDIGLQLIQFILDGHWQGNCRGLLGSHSFDQIEELKNPSGMQMVNSWTAAEAWSYHLNQTTPWKTEVNNTYLSTNGNVILKKQCMTYFNKLVACFSMLSVKPWLEACQVNSAPVELSQLPELEVENKTEAQMEINEHICRIVKGYVQGCNQQDIPVRVPSECVECNRSLKADGLTQVEYTESPAWTGHVIFVLQLHQCMTERMQEISEILRILDHEKTKQTVFFCAVFDGAQEYQGLSWLTSKSGNLSMTGEQLLQTLETVLRNRQALKRNDTRPNSFQVLDAVMAVVRRPSPSAPVHESILLYSCGKCDATTSAMYGTVQRMLQRKGMEFHYLPFASFKTAEGISTDSFLLRSDGSMTEFDGSKLNVRLNMGSVIPPRDQCSIVAQTSRGYIWAYRDVVTSLIRRRLIATTLAKILTRPISVKKLCHCRDNLFGQGQLDCVANNSVNALST